jgi:hypothetical protein
MSKTNGYLKNLIYKMTNEELKFILENRLRNLTNKRDVAITEGDIYSISIINSEIEKIKEEIENNK